MSPTSRTTAAGQMPGMGGITGMGGSPTIRTSRAKERVLVSSEPGTWGKKREEIEIVVYGVFKNMNKFTLKLRLQTQTIMQSNSCCGTSSWKLFSSQ